MGIEGAPSPFCLCEGGENRFGNGQWCQHALVCKKNTQNPGAALAQKLQCKRFSPAFPCAPLFPWNWGEITAEPPGKSPERPVQNPDRKTRGRNWWGHSCLNEGTHLILTMEIQYFLKRYLRPPVSCGQPWIPKKSHYGEDKEKTRLKKAFLKI